MGEASQMKERIKNFIDLVLITIYKINLLKNSIVLHCHPAYRGKENTRSNSPYKSKVYDQA